MIDYRISSSFFGVGVAFSKRSWPYLVAMAIPWLLCAGQRSITRMAKLADFKRSLSGYYRFLSSGKWRMAKKRTVVSGGLALVVVVTAAVWYSAWAGSAKLELPEWCK